ncbi:tetratricopeptide repeat protein [uncultured Aquimarina sp.]|uniref:tetratricopeptide repeat-containing sensor histidine kinase n=1 Tax=uncultured Aquimarina sp. TaxID=575652 RepID=UPI002626C5BC|nr:tetratricopeptide repeat protein [uncultured Aquimarina sp.]
MNIVYIRKIFILISFCGSFLCFGQKSVTIKLDSAIDSLDTNPAYSYMVLSQISKNKKHLDSIKAKAKLYLGSYFNSIGVVDSSMYYTRASLIHLRDKKYKAKAYRLLGSSHRRKGQIDNAIELLYKSLKISEEISYQDMISKVKSDLGLLYANKKEFDKAIRFLQESIDSAVSDQAVYGNYVNIGTIYFFKKDFKNAEKYFLRAFEMMPPDKDPKVSATIALNLGSVLYENKKYNQAIEYYEKSKQIADAHGFVDKSLNAIIHKAVIIGILGDHSEAVQMLTNAMIKAKDISNLEIQTNIYENLVTVYKDADNHESANDALVQFHILRDSLNNRKQRKEITELEVKYETATKEKEILVLKEDQLLKEAEIKRQRLLKRFYIIGFIIVLIPIIGLLLVYYQKLQVKNKYNAQKEEINKQKITSFLKEQELKLANTYVIAQNEERNRIARELHDSIGGNLAAIKLQMIDIQKDKGIQDTIINQLDDTYEQVREISHNLIPKKINQTAFTNYITDYINTIEKVTDPEITFIPHPVEKINIIDDNQKVEIFKIIQELMTNALKHAKAKVIEVCLNAYSDSIEIIFEDDGIGFDAKKETNGIGLQNIKKRLTLLKAKIDIDSAINRGTAIRIEIPTILNDKKKQI